MTLAQDVATPFTDLSIPEAVALRTALAEFVAGGWMQHVMSRQSWWITRDGVLKPVRRQHVAFAFEDTWKQTRRLVGEGITLYRTLLLADDFNVSSLLGNEQDFGLFWTSSIWNAQRYRPRRCYQTTHPMPAVGIPHVIEVDDVRPDDIDFVATVGCRLANPTLEEVRLKAGIRKRARRISVARGLEDEFPVRATPPVPGVMPLPEGPGFSENMRILEEVENRLPAEDDAPAMTFPN